MTATTAAIMARRMGDSFMGDREYTMLVIRARYTLADGTERVWQLSALSGSGWSPEEMARWRTHQFRRFDYEFPRDLQQRGEFYGSTIGAIQSAEVARSWPDYESEGVTVSDG